MQGHVGLVCLIPECSSETQNMEGVLACYPAAGTPSHALPALGLEPRTLAIAAQFLTG